MSSDVCIRDLRPGDVETVVDIAVAAWAPIYASYRRILGEEVFAAGFPDWRTEKARQVRQGCDDGDPAMVYVAEKEGKTVGFITFYVDAGCGVAEIANNAVHPDFQGSGIGPIMYRHVLDRLRSLGVRAVRVGTGGDPSHAPARRAYEKAGFSARLQYVTYYQALQDGAVGDRSPAGDGTAES